MSFCGQRQNCAVNICNKCNCMAISAMACSHTTVIMRRELFQKVVFQMQYKLDV